MSTFSVLQYNTLADVLSTDSFPLVSSETLVWENRSIKLIENILKNNPDIICLEEVDHFDDWFLPKLSAHGYDGIFLPKVKDDKPTTDGCALFYRKSYFSLVSQQSLRYCDYMEGNPRQVALIALLNDGHRYLYVVVTHLKAGFPCEMIRLKEAGILCRHLEKESGTSDTSIKESGSSDTSIKKVVPMIICGDLNTEPTGPIYNLLNTGMGSLDGHKENTSLSLKSAYAHYQPEGEPSYTTWKIRPPNELCRTIDYIFFTTDFFKVTKLRPLPSRETIPTSRLPSNEHPSDHLPLQAIFEWV